MLTDITTSELGSQLARQGYWPAWAMEGFAAGKFTEVVQLCRERLVDEPHLLSGRAIYARALCEVGQFDLAREQGYAILATDPDNLVALKLLGDIAYRQNDAMAALSHYERVLELDPECRGLACRLSPRPIERTHMITLTRPEEPSPSEQLPLRSIPFYTETMADLYLAQGYPRLAATVYKVLHERSRHPRFLEKLAKAEEKVKAKP